ncbi:NAD(+) synthase [Ralstonia solanacearum]|uniref:NAD(+) synthase n=1 Tax=Ralstonia solanacearum TaxID=305 RepID=UPI0018D080DF|nr:NAD(+) synthase [Ralstonia solanacearum]
MPESNVFFNPYGHDFARVAVASPQTRVADPAFNVRQAIGLMRQASERKALIVLFPELGISAYTCDDLFQQQALLDACDDALQTLLAETVDLELVAIIGLPLQVDGLLFNCAATIHRGRVLGLVPKLYLPNYREFYERRQFASGDMLQRDHIDRYGQSNIPIGTDLLFHVPAQPLLIFHIEICEDLWVPIPPSSLGAMAGATLLLNLSASNATVGKADFRRELVGNQSARCLAAYAYSAAGWGESTTDLAWDGHGLIYENGTLLAQAERFVDAPQLIVTDIDLARLNAERMRQTSFGQAVQHHGDACARFRRVNVPVKVPHGALPELCRPLERFPFVPADPVQRDARCREVYEIQVQGLVKRMQATAVHRLVIGVSGGLDSAQALLVCAQAMDKLGLPRNSILACIMPGFASSDRTCDQARRLVAALHCHVLEIDIRASCEQMLRDIGHPFAEGQPIYDVTFENVQAGQRTSCLFRLANLYGAMVVGTGDLSELALGWCTYGVGDHMSHYAVNASVPKTLVQYLTRWVAEKALANHELTEVLQDILNTVISPELVPPQASTGGLQSTEDAIGPFALQDFFLYYVLRYGFRPSRVAFMAWIAWHDAGRGAWPKMPEHQCRAYSLAEIKHWLGVFLHRFFQDMQYKRSCIPNAPKVGSGGSLSPRGDYRAPSDASARAWLDDLAKVPDTDA